MPVLRLIRERFEREQPLAGIRIGACLHVTTETANLMRTLKAGGADVVLAASNPLSTKDDVAAALVAEYGIATYARRGEDRDTYYAPPERRRRHASRRSRWTTAATSCRCSTASARPRSRRSSPGPRRRRPASSASRRWPPTARSASRSSRSTRPRRSTSSTTATGPASRTVDGILRATNILLAGRNVVVAGYGWVGRGIASRMAGMGAHVAIIEVDPVRALEALMDGFQVMTAGEAAPWGELFVTATGNVNVFRREHFAAMRDGAIMANSGHFDAELDLKALREMAEGHVRDVRENVQEFDLGGQAR